MRPIFPQNPYLAIIKRDLLLAFRKPGQMLNPLFFYLLVVSLFPLAIGPGPRILSITAPGVIWVAGLLAILMSLDNLFRSDFADGSLEQLSLSPQPLPLLLLAKIAAHWLTTGLPLLLLSPVLASFFSLSTDSLVILLATLLLGTPTLSLVGAIGAALTLNVRSNGALLALLILPLYVPVLIFAAGTVNAADSGLPISGQLYFLAALLVLALTLAPLAVAAAVKINLN